MTARDIFCASADKQQKSSAYRTKAIALVLCVALAACGGPAPQVTTPQTAPVNDKTAAAPIIETFVAPIEEFDKTAYPPAPPRADNAVTVGLLLPMGDERRAIRNLAGHLYKAAQLALFDSAASNASQRAAQINTQANTINSEINATPTEVILRLHDTKGTPEGAREAVKAAIAADVDFLVGPLFAASAKAIAPVLQGRDIKALAFSNDSRAANNNIWLMGFLPEQNIDRVVSQAIAQGLTRFGALLPEGPYGERIGTQFNAAVSRFGGTVVQVESYPPDAKDMFEPVKKLARFESRTAAHAAEMTRLKNEALALLSAEEKAALPRDKNAADDALEPDALFKSLTDSAPELVSAYEALKLTETLGDIPYDAVFLPEGGLALRNLAPLLPYFDIDPKRVKFIGTALWDDPALSQEPPLHGGWFAAPDGRNWSGFAARYETVYRRAPPRLAAMAYDGVSLAARLATIAPDDPFALPLLTNTNGFAGIDGIIRLRPGGLNERGLAVREITRTTPLGVSTAPASFVVHDRRLRSAAALADSLRQENPDLAFPQADFMGDNVQLDVLQQDGTPVNDAAVNDVANTLGVLTTPSNNPANQADGNPSRAGDFIEATAPSQSN